MKKGGEGMREGGKVKKGGERLREGEREGR